MKLCFIDEFHVSMVYVISIMKSFSGTIKPRVASDRINSCQWFA